MTIISDETLLTDDAEKHIQRYVDVFNSGDAEQLDRMYTEDAVAVWGDEPLTGQARREYTSAFLASRPVMAATAKHSYVTGDTALMVVEWAIDVPQEDGEPEHHEGVGLDVLRRGPDGLWRHAIDDPYGEVSSSPS